MYIPQYPLTIDNGAGERMTFHRRVPGPTGDRVVVENWVAPRVGPPMHVHLRQTEALTVHQGRMGYQRLGQAPQYAGPGDEVVFAAGDAHRFWNAGTETLWGTGYIEPADNIEYFLQELFASQRRAGRGRPSFFDLAFLARRYRSEFAMVEVPLAVQRLVFPPVVALGALLGRYDRYADAPAPVG